MSENTDVSKFDRSQIPENRKVSPDFVAGTDPKVQGQQMIDEVSGRNIVNEYRRRMLEKYPEPERQAEINKANSIIEFTQMRDKWDKQ